MSRETVRSALWRFEIHASSKDARPHRLTARKLDVESAQRGMCLAERASRKERVDDKVLIVEVSSQKDATRKELSQDRRNVNRGPVGFW